MEYQQRRSLGQGAVFALQLPGQVLDLLAFGALLGPFGLGRQGGVGLAAGLAPDADLLRKQPLVPAVFAQLQLPTGVAGVAATAPRPTAWRRQP